jgi:hypothetical protein
MANQRHQLTMTDLQAAAASVMDKTDYRARQKGMGVMSSGHEILGIIQEEVQEYQDEVHGKTNKEAKIEELKDIAVAAIWGIASIESGGVDW